MNAQKLLDNGWMIHLMRQVDLKYSAAARRPGEKMSDIYQMVDENGTPLPMGPEMLERSVGPRMPHRIFVADTPDAAIDGLVDQMLGLQPA